MNENPITVPQQIDGQPRLRDRTVRPEGTLPKQAQTYVIAGVSVVILLAVMFSKNHAQSAAKTQRREPTVVITEGNDKKISDFGQEMTEEQRAAQKTQLEKQLNVQARSLDFTSPQTQSADALHVGPCKARSRQHRLRTRLSSTSVSWLTTRASPLTLRFLQNIFPQRPQSSSDFVGRCSFTLASECSRQCAERRTVRSGY